jgi:serine protease AprX
MRRTKIFFIVLLTFCAFTGRDRAHGNGFTEKYWVLFRDKGNEVAQGSFEVGDILNRTDLSERALKRRAQNADEIVTVDDLPVFENYITALKQAGAEIVVRSRWLNAVSAYVTPDVLLRIREMEFVYDVRQVARIQQPKPVPEDEWEVLSDRNRIESSGLISVQVHSYGPSEQQITLHNIHTLHAAGITGKGVLIGFIDTGFDWAPHEALQETDVIAERDIVQEHYSEDILPLDHYSHGTLVFSVVAGKKEGSLIGVAYDASFLLAATEDIRSETPAEEDFWVEGLEWMEALGVDIVSTSLGYSTFDFGFPGYTPDDMDGKTAMTTRAAGKAYERGVLVIASAGNEGSDPKWRIVTSPADGEHVIAAGAVFSNGEVVGFSSRGPTADGRIKPDVVALGVSVVGVSTTPGSYRTANGTSLSAPIISGSIGLIRSAQPSASAEELRHMIRMSSGSASQPDNDRGWGLIDARAALAYPLLRYIGPNPVVSMFLVSANGIDQHTVRLFYRTAFDPGYTEVSMEAIRLLENRSSGEYRFVFPNYVDISGGVRFFTMMTDSTGTESRYPSQLNAEYFFHENAPVIHPVETITPDRFIVHQNYPNPFNSQTVIRIEVPDVSNVSVSIYTLLGQYVTTLTDRTFTPGVHELVWNARPYASGIYFYRVNYRNRTDTGTMMLIR